MNTSKGSKGPRRGSSSKGSKAKSSKKPARRGGRPSGHGQAQQEANPFAPQSGRKRHRKGLSSEAAEAAGVDTGSEPTRGQKGRQSAKPSNFTGPKPKLRRHQRNQYVPKDTISQDETLERLAAKAAEVQKRENAKAKLLAAGSDASKVEKTQLRKAVESTQPEEPKKKRVKLGDKSPSSPAHQPKKKAGQKAKFNQQTTGKAKLKNKKQDNKKGADKSAPEKEAAPRKKEAVRLHKYIANCGYCSRRRAELLIADGLVKVNSKPSPKSGCLVYPGHDVVTINGELIHKPKPLTVILNKPGGYITSTHDTHERLTVMDLLPRALTEAGVLPAGRLDYDTEGLLIFTNNGELQHRITHPRFGCVKEYRVHTSRALRDNDIRRLERGIMLREFGKRTAPANIEKPRRNKDNTGSCHIFIAEGMKRQVKRMFSALGLEVLRLERLAIGRIDLGNLKPGEWRELSASEVASLWNPKKVELGPERRKKAIQEKTETEGRRRPDARARRRF